MWVWLDGLISYYVFDEGRLVVVYVGLSEDMYNCVSGKVCSFVMYGDMIGEIDEFGLFVCVDWVVNYCGCVKVVYGYILIFEVEWVNGIICIDMGCVFGGKLMVLCWLE